jgi:hypothetical protein
MDWDAFFKSLKENISLDPAKPVKWYDPRGWKLTEWGSIAAITGTSFVIADRFKKK